MIELRWVERWVNVYRDGVGYTELEKVLQYRVEQEVIRGFTDQFGHGLTTEKVWSDWQDVPTVKE